MKKLEGNIVRVTIEQIRHLAEQLGKFSTLGDGDQEIYLKVENGQISVDVFFRPPAVTEHIDLNFIVNHKSLDTTTLDNLSDFNDLKSEDLFNTPEQKEMNNETHALIADTDQLLADLEKYSRRAEVGAIWNEFTTLVKDTTLQ